jgi:16S rRNA (uracil1498-N3)-methyltransferase
MPRRRFFVPQEQIRNGIAVLTADQAHHLRAVLRLRAGEEVELFDGSGFSYSGTIQCRGAEIHIGPLREIDLPKETGSTLVLAAALIKPDRFEWILQKGTELGVERFLPLETKYSTARIPQARLAARLDRWQRIVREACKQSRRGTIPKVHSPLPFGALLAAPEYAAYARFMLHEKAPERLNADLPAANPLLLCVGPEGGWDSAEAHAAERAGFRIVSMGTRVLRAETAALAALAIFQFLLSDSQTRNSRSF